MQKFLLIAFPKIFEIRILSQQHLHSSMPKYLGKLFAGQFTAHFSWKWFCMWCLSALAVGVGCSLLHIWRRKILCLKPRNHLPNTVPFWKNQFCHQINNRNFYCGFCILFYTAELSNRCWNSLQFWFLASWTYEYLSKTFFDFHEIIQLKAMDCRNVCRIFGGF